METITKMSMFFGLYILALVINAIAIMISWNFFITPVFFLDELTLMQALGAALLIQALKGVKYEHK